MSTNASVEQLRLTIPLVKLDVERRLVIGSAAMEAPDKAREILDYATARPAFEAWSQDCQKRSGGASLGNVRAMHNPKLAAGKLDEIAFDDSNKSINVVAKIVDDNEWRKCLEGVYTGFSVGGGYASKWKDPDTGLTRYTPRVAEISLVDNPCIPGCTFAELVKADGAIERLELRGRSHSFAELWESRPKTFAELWAAREAAAPRAPSFADLWGRV